jgi:hypothetical protein
LVESVVPILPTLLPTPGTKTAHTELPPSKKEEDPGEAPLFSNRPNPYTIRTAVTIGDVPSATAILDRFLHHAEIITITGRSYRLKDHPATTAPTKPRSGKQPTLAANSAEPEAAS